MGLIEWLTGWEYVGDTMNRTIKVDRKYYANPKKLINRINQNIIKIAEKKSDKISAILGRKQVKQGNVYVTMRHEKLPAKIPAFKFHIKGKRFIYRFKHSSIRVTEANGHGLMVSSGMKIWRKLRTDRS